MQTVQCVVFFCGALCGLAGTRTRCAAWLELAQRGWQDRTETVQLPDFGLYPQRLSPKDVSLPCARARARV